MGGQYGMTLAAKAIQQGRYDDAIVEAGKSIALDAGDPEPLVERAQAFAALDRHADAATDLELALTLDEEAPVLDRDAVDDALFSALLGAAKMAAASDLEMGLKRLEHYANVLPEGSHIKDAADWSRRLRGELPSAFVKENR